jgi:hypothetical protein
MDHDISHGVLYVALASLNTSAMENVKLALTRIRREKRREATCDLLQTQAKILGKSWFAEHDL